MDPNTPPPYSELGERMRDRYAPLAPTDDQNGYAFAKLAHAMMAPFLQLAELVDPPDPYVPWEPLFDVDICPAWALPWLAQVVGVRITAGLSEADMRTMVKELGGFKRGTPEAIKHAAGLALTGSKNVWLRERDNGDAYRLEVVTLDTETPDLEALRLAVLWQKPAGIVMEARTTVGWDYQQMTTDFTGQTYADIPAVYEDYGELIGGPLA